MDSATSFFAETRSKDEANSRCADCGIDSPQWASISHGSFICLTCSGIHRGLGGVSTSFVRSLSMDTWSPTQKAYMAQGGNSRLAAFFAEYNLTDAPAKNTAARPSKYVTKAAQYYRDLLKHTVEGKQPPPMKPSLEEGQQPMNTSRTDAGGLNGQSSGGASGAGYLRSGSAGGGYGDTGFGGSGNHPDGFGGNEETGSLSFDAAAAGVRSLGSMAFSAFTVMASKAQEAASKAQEAAKTTPAVENLQQSVTAGAAWVGERSKEVLDKVNDPGFWQTAGTQLQGAVAVASEQLGAAVGKAGEFISQQVDAQNGAVRVGTADGAFNPEGRVEGLAPGQSGLGAGPSGLGAAPSAASGGVGVGTGTGVATGSLPNTNV